MTGLEEGLPTISLGERELVWNSPVANCDLLLKSVYRIAVGPVW